MPSESNHSPGLMAVASGKHDAPVSAGIPACAAAAISGLLAPSHRPATESPLVMPRHQERERTERGSHQEPMMKSAFIKSGIHSSDVVQLLRREGFDVAPWRLRYAAAKGYIPDPFVTGSGDHAWRQGDLPAITRYFKNPRRPGRPKVAK